MVSSWLMFLLISTCTFCNRWLMSRKPRFWTICCWWVTELDKRSQTTDRRIPLEESHARISKTHPRHTKLQRWRIPDTVVTFPFVGSSEMQIVQLRKQRKYSLQPKPALNTVLKLKWGKVTPELHQQNGEHCQWTVSLLGILPVENTWLT